MEKVSKWGAQWLSKAADDPGDCWVKWLDDPQEPYLLRAGRLFDVMVTGQRIGMETFDQMSRKSLPLGPVMIDWKAGRVGFFLPPHSRERFARMVKSETEATPEYRYLDGGSYVVVPGPMVLAPRRYQWLRAPTRRLEDTPVRTIALAVAFVAAAALITRVDRYGEQHRAPYVGEPVTETPGQGAPGAR